MNTNSNAITPAVINQSVNEHSSNGVVPHKILYTLKEVVTIMHINTGYVYLLIKSRVLPAMKMDSYKIKHTTIMTFLEKIDGYDISDPRNLEKISTSEE